MQHYVHGHYVVQCAAQPAREVLDRVTDNHEAVTITRQNAPSAVLMSLEDYDALMETLHRLRSPRNAARLSDAIADVKAGKHVRVRKLSAT